MIHMLSSFNLKPDETFAEFQTAYTAFIADLHAADVIAAAGPLGTRVSDTPMDTDDENPRQVFSLLSFRDRAQLDASYAHIEARATPGTTNHINMYRRITDALFTCWEDVS